MWLCFIFIIFVFPIEKIKQSLEQKRNVFSLLSLWRVVCKHMSSQEFEVDGGDAVDLHPLSNQQLCFPSSLYVPALQPLKMTTPFVIFCGGVCWVPITFLHRQNNLKNVRERSNNLHKNIFSQRWASLPRLSPRKTFQARQKQDKTHQNFLGFSVFTAAAD